MRILVTGASGFIGSALTGVLEGARNEVVAAGRETYGDLARFEDWPRLLAGLDAVIHLAALAHCRNRDPATLTRVNVDACARLGRAAAAAGCRVVFLSTVKVHGEETAEERLTETSAIDPKDAYARSKAAAEAVLREAAGARLTVIRTPLVYGPRVKANFLSLLRAVECGIPLPLGSIRNRRSLLYVGNLADAIRRCLEEPQASGKTYLVADGAGISTSELCRAIGRALGRPARLFPFPPSLLELAPPLRKLTRSLDVDDSLIRSELDWRPPFSADQGLAETAAWYRANLPRS